MVKTYEVRYLDPQEIHFERQGDTMALTLADGSHYPWVILRCAYPVSSGEVLISVRDGSSEDQDEIGILQDWRQLKEDDREAVAAELGLHYFVPKVKRVLKVKEEFGFLYWSVDTDKGPKEFVMRNNIIHYARQVGPERWLLIDVNEARFEIPKLALLDHRSQGIVKRVLCL